MIRADWLSEHLNSGGFIGSPTNVAVCTGTAIMLFAVRYGYAPGTARNAKLEKGLNLADSGSDMLTGDPMGKSSEKPTTDRIECLIGLTKSNKVKQSRPFPPLPFVQQQNFPALLCLIKCIQSHRRPM